MAEETKQDIQGAERHFTLVTLPAGTLMHRVHLGLFQAVQFNPTGCGNARFSPIANAEGAIIPTLYAGTSFGCAAMETVFHDVPYKAGFKTYPKRRLANHCYSTIKTRANIQLVDLTAKALRKLGLTRADLIDTQPSGYSFSRGWAEVIHKLEPRAQGLRWVSRQDDTAFAVVLFGDRVQGKDISGHDTGRDLLTHESTYRQLMDLAHLIGVLIVSD